MSERTVTIGDVELCTEPFGNPADPPVLLIMGAGASMTRWDVPFCAALAAEGRFVIRYDNRDTGRSVTYEPGAPPYTLLDLAADAVGVLDAYDLSTAHVVGLSMGGMIAELLGIHHPNRVRSLTLMMTSPYGPEDPDLPQMDEEFLEVIMRPPPDWRDRDAAADYMVETWRACTRRRPFDEDRYRALALIDIARSKDLASSRNHGAMADIYHWRDRLGEICTPTLVIHGTADPVLPLGHGVALRDEIPNARLMTLDGAGHELHTDDWPAIIAAIVEHTAAADADIG